MNMNVSIVKSHFQYMQMTSVSIAAMNVTSQIDLEVARMSEEQFKRDKLYLATMHLAKNLLNQGIISKKQYGEIQDKFTNKYKPSLSTLFTQIDLL